MRKSLFILCLLIINCSFGQTKQTLTDEQRLNKCIAETPSSSSQRPKLVKYTYKSSKVSTSSKSFFLPLDFLFWIKSDKLIKFTNNSSI